MGGGLDEPQSGLVAHLDKVVADDAHEQVTELDVAALGLASHGAFVPDGGHTRVERAWRCSAGGRDALSNTSTTV